LNVLHTQLKTEQEIRGEREVELLDCARSGDIDRCVELLALGAGVDATDTCDNTPLHHACFFGYEDIVRLLLGAGADGTLVDDQGCSAMSWAAAGDHLGVCKLLMAAGLSVQTASLAGGTPLQLAVVNHNIPLVQYLMECGAKSSYSPVNPEENYLTPFQWAVKKKRLALVQYMGVAGSEDLEQRTVAGETLIKLAGKGLVSAYLRSRAAQRTVEDGLGEVSAVVPAVSRVASHGPL
jgi:ankyrin repeat protein